MDILYILFLIVFGIISLWILVSFILLPIRVGEIRDLLECIDKNLKKRCFDR